jgi:hypothetical protein
MSMLAIRRTRSWRVEQPNDAPTRGAGTGAGSLLVAAFAIALFYFFFV